ncbi:phosphate ABC transporter phosphate-binding protein [Microbacterium sp. AG1240]|uniref:phosphate ABC transporter substrate-binding protein PstS n=1 Tax=Microbacterium sp. AG1240 TaxID=2183992 RepID=UPI000F25D34A|nr:phosphate ABC transporter substrate-binding protein PstS [Microbacterium sp. AG1240]RKT33398.1 phosphate ABC transporter phosphate-binding protein [Microbacterium sp. AG1240]
MIRRRFRPLATALVALLVSTAAVTGATASAQAADPYANISGSGSTWSQNALDQWRRNVQSNYGMTVDYRGLGSTAGRGDFINRTVDFAISEIPFQLQPTESGAQPEKPTAGSYAYMPIVAGGTAFMYNLKIGGKRVTNLRLSGATVSKIFAGQITNWNNPEIQADNPGLAMPDRAIQRVARSDGSGSTAQFTMWMSKQHGDIWTTGMTSQFPGNVGATLQSGSLGVSGYVSQGYGEGAITYVEYSYAVKSGFPVAKVLNAAGYYIEPTASSVAVAMLKAQINTNSSSPDYLTQILDGVYGNTDPRTYPLSSYSYMIVPTVEGGTFTADKGRTLGEFARYVLCEGQQQAEQLGYSPLPMNLVQAGAEQIKRIPGAQGSVVDINKCNNPTFQPGDSLDNNRLAQTAKQPAECDRQGPNQCTTGTAGASDTDTDVTGSGSGGSAAGAAAAGTAAAASGGAAAADPAAVDAAAVGGDAVYDANGALVSGSVAGGRTAVSSPFTIPDPVWGGPQLLMLAAAMLLLGSIILPPVLSRRLRGGGRKTG